MIAEEIIIDLCVAIFIFLLGYWIGKAHERRINEK
jgi:hypothetical protein